MKSLQLKMQTLQYVKKLSSFPLNRFLDGKNEVFSLKRKNSSKHQMYDCIYCIAHCNEVNQNQRSVATRVALKTPLLLSLYLDPLHPGLATCVGADLST
jgi:hypothetical protein